VNRPAVNLTDAPVAAVIDLPRALPDAIGMGAFLKATICTLSGNRAMVSETAGDLSSLEQIEVYDNLLRWALEGMPNPRCVAHDMHPNFYTTTEALALDARTLPVQHHHAHTLATAWEHGHTEPVLGLSLDGYGMGPDQASWGGELLWVDGLDYRRIGHLVELPQPGGDIAAREPWRMASAALFALGRAGEIATRFGSQPHAAMMAQMLERGVNCPETSSCGRLFDAACGLAGVRDVAEFEGQAPMEFEALADALDVLPNGWELENGRLNLLPLLDRLSSLSPTEASNLFHGTLIAAMAYWVLQGRDITGINIVAFGGGCFLNKVLTEGLASELENNGMKVLQPQKLSPGDAGLSFGQAIAAGLDAESQGESPCA